MHFLRGKNTAENETKGEDEKGPWTKHASLLKCVCRYAARSLGMGPEAVIVARGIGNVQRRLARKEEGGVAGCGTGRRRKALTGAGRASYHRKMHRMTKRRAVLRAGCGVLAIVWLCGCEDAAKKPVVMKVPALNPAQSQEPQVPEVRELPPPKIVPQGMESLLPRAPGGIPYLIEQVKAKFASGEAN